MALTEGEQIELDRLELLFEEAGGRGVEYADRLDWLRVKAELPTVRDLIAALQRLDADANQTFVISGTEDELDIVVGQEYVDIRDIIEDLA